MFSISILISIFPFFNVSGKRYISFFGILLCVGLRHPASSCSRDSRGCTGTERDRTSSALTLIIVRCDREHIIAVPFYHFALASFDLINFEHVHYSSLHIINTLWFKFVKYNYYLLCSGGKDNAHNSSKSRSLNKDSLDHNIIRIKNILKHETN